MAGDYTWDQMPEELAHRLFSLANRLTPESTLQEAYDLQEWLVNEMQHCQASKEVWPRLTNRCTDLPVPGSEFCSKHIPPGDLDEHDYNDE